MQASLGNPVKIKVIMMMGQVEQEKRLFLEDSMGDLVGYAKELDKKLLGKLYVGPPSWHF